LTSSPDSPSSPQKLKLSNMGEGLIDYETVCKEFKVVLLWAQYDNGKVKSACDVLLGNLLRLENSAICPWFKRLLII
jgi:hypothetical protein